MSRKYQIAHGGAGKGVIREMECSRCDYYKAHNCKRQCMDLPEGKTCADCIHVIRCTNMFGAKTENNYCGFEPVRFVEKN